tara:strand:- start:72 stop:2033 length:1962 start_codon:yes stop_codon:yes gene_type:complete
MAFNPGFRKPSGLPQNPVDEIRGLISSGRLDIAEKKLRLLRRTRPRDADLLNMSGVVALQRNDLKAAWDHFSKAAVLAPKRSDILHHLGEAGRLTERWDAAATAYRQALAAGAAKYTTWRGLGLALLALNDAEGAVTALEKAAAGNPQDQITLLKLAEAQAGAGDSQAAIGTARQALALDPVNPAARNNLGVLLLDGDSPDEAIEHLQQATDLAPDRLDYRLNLAAACRTAGLMDQADLHYGQAIRQPEIAASGLSAYASLLEMMNRTEEAGDLAARALQLDPADAPALLTRAILNRRARQYQAALDILEPMEGRQDLGYELAASRYFEMGTNLDRLGRYSEAWSAYARCNAVHDRSDVARPMDRDAFFADIRNAQNIFTADRVSRWPTNIPDDQPAPVFLVGFPRSGTTLTEQILAAHPAVLATDERELVRGMAQAASSVTGRNFAYPQDIDAIEDHHIPALRQVYRESAEALFGEAVRGRLLLDKLPLNIVHLGFIRRVFPDAKVLIALRDPRDVCLSAFCQNFRLNTAMIQFLTIERTAEAYCAAMGLLLSFEQSLGLQTLRFRYEDVVADLRGEATRILTFLGLDWTDELQSFAEKSAGRTISTPSARDVASGLYTRALGRHTNYAAQLAPVAADLAPFVRELGYDAGR